MLRTLLIKAGESDRLRRIVSGWRPTRAVVAKFVAGETLEDGLAAVRTVAQTQRTVTLDYLGESVTEAGAARPQPALSRGPGAHRRGRAACRRVRQADADGPAAGPQLARELLGRDRARPRARAASTSRWTWRAATSPRRRSRWSSSCARAGRTYVGCAVQSYLHRTRADVERLSDGRREPAAVQGRVRRACGRRVPEPRARSTPATRAAPTTCCATARIRDSRRTTTG